MRLRPSVEISYVKRKRTTTKKQKRLDVEVLACRVHVHISTKRTVQAKKVCMLRTANNEYSSLSRLLYDACTAAAVRVLTIISYRAWSKWENKGKDRRKTKN